LRGLSHFGNLDFKTEVSGVGLDFYFDRFQQQKKAQGGDARTNKMMKRLGMHFMLCESTEACEAHNLECGGASLPRAHIFIQSQPLVW
tara:strand:- start:100 stop:363 length:264 start_codon:yes stop_codon:yes gene_type:complete